MLVAAWWHGGQLQSTQQGKVGGQCGDLGGQKPGMVDDQRTVAHGQQRTVLAEIVWAVGTEQVSPRRLGRRVCCSSGCR